MKLEDKNFSLVLSGGGALGIAHLGVLADLEKQNLIPNDIVGTSMGGIIAACLAIGLKEKEIYKHICEFANVFNWVQFSFSGNSIIKSSKIDKIFTTILIITFFIGCGGRTTNTNSSKSDNNFSEDNNTVITDNGNLDSDNNISIIDNSSDDTSSIDNESITDTNNSSNENNISNDTTNNDNQSTKTTIKDDESINNKIPLTNQHLTILELPNNDLNFYFAFSGLITSSMFLYRLL